MAWLSAKTSSSDANSSDKEGLSRVRTRFIGGAECGDVFACLGHGRLPWVIGVGDS